MIEFTAQEVAELTKKRAGGNIDVADVRVAVVAALCMAGTPHITISHGDRDGVLRLIADVIAGPIRIPGR